MEPLSYWLADLAAGKRLPNRRERDLEFRIQQLEDKVKKLERQRMLEDA